MTPLALPPAVLWLAAALGVVSAILGLLGGDVARVFLSLAEAVLCALLARADLRDQTERVDEMSLRTRMTIFGVGALLIALASFAILLVALTGGMESNATGIFVFSVIGVLCTLIGIVVLLSKKNAPTK